MLSSILLLALSLASPLAAGSAKAIEKEAVVKALRAEVWKAWTTNEGARSFFAPEVKIELRPGGAYEMYFDPSQPAGLRGGETNQVIAFEPERTLLFSWNAPPKFGALRSEHTYVLLRLEDADGGGTRVRLTHFGWRGGDQWDEIYRYFERAWDVVMDRFRKSFAERAR